MPPILMIHGMWSRPLVFAELIPELEADGIRSHAVTLPFHDLPPGEPAPPPALGRQRLEHYAAHVAQEARTLAEPPILLGHSMGGLVAQIVGQTLDHRGLILLAPAPAADTQAPALAPLRTTRSVTSKWQWWDRPTLVDREDARWGVFNGVPDDEADLALSLMTWDSGRALAQIAFPWADRRRGSTIDRQRLTRPALVLAGDRDRIVPEATSRRTAAALRRHAARVEYRVFDGAGHWFTHHALRPRLAAEIRRFAARV